MPNHAIEGGPLGLRTVDSRSPLSEFSGCQSQVRRRDDEQRTQAQLPILRLGLGLRLRQRHADLAQLTTQLQHRQANDGRVVIAVDSFE